MKWVKASERLPDQTKTTETVIKIEFEDGWQTRVARPSELAITIKHLHDANKLQWLDETDEVLEEWPKGVIKLNKIANEHWVRLKCEFPEIANGDKRELYLTGFKDGYRSVTGTPE